MFGRQAGETLREHLHLVLRAGSELASRAAATISRRLPNVAFTFTAGVIEMLAEASEPTRASAITSFVNSTRTGEWREIAPVECWLMDVTQVGSGAPTAACRWVACRRCS